MESLQKDEQHTQDKVKALVLIADGAMITVIMGYISSHLPPNPLIAAQHPELNKREGGVLREKVEHRKIRISSFCLWEGRHA